MIVLLHGFTGAPDVWDPVTACLGGPTVAETLAGHHADLLEPGGFADEVLRLRARLAGRAPVHLVGYSMGARLALALSLAAPAWVRRLTLIGVNPGLEGDAARAARVAADEAWARLLETEGVDAFLERWESQPLFASQRALPREVCARHRARRRGHDPRGLAAALRRLGLGAMRAMWTSLPDLGMPVTYVSGQQDRKFVSLAARAAASTPRGRHRVVEGAGHDVVLEAPRALAAILEESP